MKKAFLTSAMFMLMMVLTSFQVDSEIGGGDNQAKPKSKGLNISLDGADNQVKPIFKGLEAESLKGDNQVKPIFNSLVLEIGGENQAKPKSKGLGIV